MKQLIDSNFTKEELDSFLQKKYEYGIWEFELSIANVIMFFSEKKNPKVRQFIRDRIERLEKVILPRGKPRGIFSAALNQAAQALTLVPCVVQYTFLSHHESFGLQLSVQNIHPPTSPPTITSSSIRETRETIPVHCCSLLS